MDSLWKRIINYHYYFKSEIINLKYVHIWDRIKRIVVYKDGLLLSGLLWVLYLKTIEAFLSHYRSLIDINSLQKLFLCWLFFLFLFSSVSFSFISFCFIYTFFSMVYLIYTTRQSLISRTSSQSASWIIVITSFLTSHTLPNMHPLLIRSIHHRRCASFILRRENLLSLPLS